VALVSDHYKVLPSQAAAELDNDPERLALTCRDLTLYAQAKAAYDAARSEEALEPWAGSKMMDRVKENAFALRKERRARGEG